MAMRAPHKFTTWSLSTNLGTHFHSCRLFSTTAFEVFVQSRLESKDLSIAEALAYSNSILKMEPMPSIRTLNRLFWSLSKLNQLSAVESMYIHLKRYRSVDFDPNVYTLNIVAKCLCRSGNVKSCFSLLGTMLKSGFPCESRTLHTLLDCLVKQGSTASVELLDWIKAEEGLCDEVIYGIVINSLCKAREHKRALEILQNMVNGGTKPNTHCYNPIISCLCKDGLIDEALSLFQDMSDSGVRPNSISYYSLISVVAGLGKWKEVNILLESMKGHRVSPDIFTVSCILNARFKEGSTVEALHLVGVMVEKGVFLDILDSSSFLRGLSRDARPEEAKLLCDAMDNVDITADRYTFNILLNGLATGFMMLEARKVFEAMIGRGEADSVAFNTMINGYCLQGEMGDAEDVFDRMETIGVSPDVRTYNTLAKGYLSVGRAEEALKILKASVLRGIRPNGATCSILKTIHAYNHERAWMNSCQYRYSQVVTTA